MKHASFVVSFIVNFYRRRKEREEISATGVIEVWGLSPREAPPEYVQRTDNIINLCHVQYMCYSYTLV